MLETLPQKVFHSKPNNADCLNCLQHWVILRLSFAIQNLYNQHHHHCHHHCHQRRHQLTLRPGMVLRAIPMVETMTNIMEMKDTMLAVVEDSGCSIRSQMHFWYLQILRWRSDCLDHLTFRSSCRWMSRGRPPASPRTQPPSPGWSKPAVSHTYLNKVVYSWN